MNHEGNLIIGLSNGQVLAASRIETTDESAFAVFGFRQKYTVSRPNLSRVWRLNSESGLPAEAAKHHGQLAAALIAMEQELNIYRGEVGEDPLVHSQCPVIFGAAALTLSINKERSSEDIDYIVSSQFADWVQDRQTLNAELDVDLADESILQLCGNWRERTCRIDGLVGGHFRLLHPMDVVMQKLLRRDLVKFQEKDIPDIIEILDFLRPDESTLLNFLSENPLRYIPNPYDHLKPSQFESVCGNTTWFIDSYLDGWDIEKLAEFSSQRTNGKLAKARIGEPWQPDNSTPLTVEELDIN